MDRTRKLANSMRLEDNDIEDIMPTVEFNNMSHQLKDFCIKTAKEAMSN